MLSYGHFVISPRMGAVIHYSDEVTPIQYNEVSEMYMSMRRATALRQSCSKKSQDTLSAKVLRY